MTAPLPPAATVGFVGLGNMGAPMARRLLAAGHQLLVFDTVEASRAALAADGARALDDVAGVAAGADVVVLMLPDSSVVDRVLHEGGLLAATAAGTTLVDMGSSQPLKTRELAAEAAELGIGYVDAPVSGGVRGAEDGRLTVMVGGDDDAVARVWPLLELMGSSVRHVGPAGAGHAVKALNNLMSAAHMQASSEALLVARRFGLDLTTVLEVVNTSSGRSGSTQNKWPNFVLPGGYDSGFGLRLMLKDMRIAVGLAEQAGVPTPLAAQAVEFWSQAAEALPPQADHTEIVRWLEGLSPEAPGADGGPAQR